MKKTIILKGFLAVVVILIVGGSLVTAGYFYREYQKVKSNPEIISQEEVKTVTEVIGKFMDLPSDEQPTLATITDQEKLKDQDFFKKAQNGDKVLIYTKARKAILFRPSTNRVIEFAPLTIGADQTGQEVSQPTQTSVAIYNGSDVSGLTKDVETKLKSLTEVTIAVRDNAQKKDYPKTIVVDVTGTNKNLADKIAALLGGEVGTLPDGEKKPETGILIIATK